VWRKRGFLQVETHREFFAPYPTPRSARLKTSQSRMTTLRRTTTMGIRALLGFSLLSLAISTWGAEQTTIKTDKDKFSYAIGYQIAESVKRQGLDPRRSWRQGAADLSRRDAYRGCSLSAKGHAGACAEKPAGRQRLSG
jgi:hypothetical protein